jgi:purine-nucleoside phosphorylase
VALSAAQAIRDLSPGFAPTAMVVLGSGLADAASAADIQCRIEYSRIPGLIRPSVVGHPGVLLTGRWGGRTVLVFQGRLHRYEGHVWDRIRLPVRIGAALGARICVLTSMSGAINPNLAPGTLVVVDDHLNAMGENPLAGLITDGSSTQFVDLTDAYSPRLRALLATAAADLNLSIEHGVYAAVTGPSYETPAEVRALRILGADVVGMSTVAEVLTARWLGLECCAVSCVANLAAGVHGTPIRHEEVLEAGRSMAERLGSLLTAFLARS